MPDEKLELIRRQLIEGQVQPGSILAKVLEGLPPEDVQKLKQKAAEGMLASELQKMAMANRFQASTVDIDDFIRTVTKMDEQLGGRAFTGYEATTKSETASGETTIRVKKGCYIATAVYGSEEHPNVRTLRNFRDRCLEQSTAGRVLCGVYYRLSPKLARSKFSKGMPRKIVRKVLDWICTRL